MYTSQLENMLAMLENLQMMLNGHVRMEQELIWTICAKQLNLQLKVEQLQ
jgi:hypothetical protein